MTYIVGIDLAKYHHECLIIRQNEDVIFKSFSFDNNAQGFDFFLSFLNQLSNSNQIKIGFEATGHYGDNLKNFLIKSG